MASQKLQSNGAFKQNDSENKPFQFYPVLSVTNHYIQLHSQGAFKKLPLNIKGGCMPTHSLSYDCPRSGAGCESILLAVCAVEHDKTFTVKYSQRLNAFCFFSPTSQTIFKYFANRILHKPLGLQCLQVSLKDQAIHPSTKRSMLTSWFSPATVRKKCLGKLRI